MFYSCILHICETYYDEDCGGMKYFAIAKYGMEFKQSELGKIQEADFAYLFFRSLATFSFGGKRKRCTKEKPPSDVICLNLQQITV